MANLAVLASGNGSNFEALAVNFENSRHKIVCLVTDKENAFALSRARRLGIPGHYVSYSHRERREAENEILAILRSYKTDFIALAGFMRLLSPTMIDAFPSRIVNIHPSLLPKYPGTHGIRESFASPDRKLGITVHYVDYGLDSGPIILQESFLRNGKESIEEIESKIHALEHIHYPKTVMRLMDTVEKKGDEF